MMWHIADVRGAANIGVDCGSDPIGSLKAMFVDLVQGTRIARGQCPALRPVFLKSHGVAHGVFRLRADLPDDLKVGIFSGSEYPAWMRFSSDTVPTNHDFKTTAGIGIKLFGTPTPKIFGPADDTTFDFLLQNFDVFFVDTATDMCELTKAGLIDDKFEEYLRDHPKTARLLEEMAHPVDSLLTVDYWSGIPFAFGPRRFVKYKLEAADAPAPLADGPRDPGYLAADLRGRLRKGPAHFRFCVQFRTDPIRMPLDEATTRWEESVSPSVHVADLVLPQQDITARGQAEYGENLAFNVWRVTRDHEPQGSIALARRAVYSASADLRRSVNGLPLGEPDEPKPALDLAPCVDRVIVRAAIHPAIGVARIGDSADEYFVGPETTDPASRAEGFYRDACGALKRQAARFRIYGFNASGEVVRELTAENANIVWTVHLANKKAQWYQFQAALDLGEAESLSLPRRNPAVPPADRASLAIDPGPRSISGKAVHGGSEHRFDTGRFKHLVVLLGEIRTDHVGRLLVLGGTGRSESPSNAPVYVEQDGLGNANDWYDDTSDGPVTAAVSINGISIPVEGAWVVVAPPNYAPDIVGWRTLYDMIVDLYVRNGWMDLPTSLSFTQDILPILRRLSDLQWVNRGFAALFGAGGPMDFSDADLVAKLAQAPDSATKEDPYGELRRALYHGFRGPRADVREPPGWPQLWPWLYGDSFGSFAPDSPENIFRLSDVRDLVLRRWADGEFVNDWPSSAPPPESIDQVPLAAQPAVLDKAALHFCLADAFHPGCEMTWPMRHLSIYEKPFRIRHRPAGSPEKDYGRRLTRKAVLQVDGPLHAQGPGDLTRWMAVPWQADTAVCRSGYDVEYDLYLPAFWPARVPNQVLTEEDYQIVVNPALPRSTRIAAFAQREDWARAIMSGTPEQVMMRMVAQFGALGVIEARPGVQSDPDIPSFIFVESLHASRLRAAALAAARDLAGRQRPLSRAEQAGWENDEQYERFRNVRIRWQQPT